MKFAEVLQTIKNDLKSEILGKSGTKFPDAHSLAKTYGVSYVTAVKLISTLKEEKIVLSIGNKCFVTNGPCRTDSDLFSLLNRSPEKKLGILLPSLTNPFYGETVEALNNTLLKRGITPVLTLTKGENEIEEMEKLVRQGCIGLFSFLKNQTPKIIDFYSRFPLPIVTIGKKLSNIDISSISSDNYSAGVTASRHLVECGYTRFVYVVNKNNFSVNNERLNGFSAGLKKLGYDLPRSNIFILDHDDAKTSNAILSFLESSQEKTGVFCYHDLTAMDLYFLVRNADFSVPERVGIVGYDNLTSITREVNLTTFAYSFNKMAEIAIEVMLETCANPLLTKKNVKVQTNMVVRKTTSPDKE